MCFVLLFCLFDCCLFVVCLFVRLRACVFGAVVCLVGCVCLRGGLLVCLFVHVFVGLFVCLFDVFVGCVLAWLFVSLRVCVHACLLVSRFASVDVRCVFLCFVLMLVLVLLCCACVVRLAV